MRPETELIIVRTLAVLLTYALAYLATPDGFHHDTIQKHRKLLEELRSTIGDLKAGIEKGS